jgi:hypothetical protein
LLIRHHQFYELNIINSLKKKEKNLIYETSLTLGLDTGPGLPDKDPPIHDGIYVYMCMLIYAYTYAYI